MSWLIYFLPALCALAGGFAGLCLRRRIKKALRDPVWEVRFAAVRAYSQIAGVADAAKIFDQTVRDSSLGGARVTALVGLEECGQLALPTVTWALRSREESLEMQALVTASIVDEEGTLHDEILPLLRAPKLSFNVRKYYLAYGIRRYLRANHRWPVDFVEVENFLRKLDDRIRIAPLATTGYIRFEPQSDDSLKVVSYTPMKDEAFGAGGRYYAIRKPAKH